MSDQVQQSVSVPITSSGEHYIEFTISAEQENYTIGYYFFVKESTSNFFWFPTKIEPVTSSYYRKYSESNNINLSFESSIDKSINDTGNTTYKFIQETQSNYNELDQLLSVGIQYSRINDTKFPILSISAKSNIEGIDTNKWAIFIYQNKIVMSVSDEISYDEDGKITNVDGQECEIFLPMAEELSDEYKENYHLISIYRNFERREGNNYYKGIYIYIDGILEGAFNSFITTHVPYEKITFFPGNYKVNELGYYCFRHSDQGLSRTWLNDNDIVGYYYTYYEKLLGGAVEESEKALYDAFFKFYL